MVDFLQDLWFDRSILREIVERNIFLGAILYVLLQALQIVVAPLPGEAGLVAGFLFGAKVGFILHIIGTALGATIAFSLARLFRNKFENRFKANPTVQKLKRLIKRGGMFGLFLAYLIPGFPKDVLNYLLGLLKISYRSFIAVNLFGRTPTSFLMALQGDLVYQGDPKKIFLALGVTLTAFGILILVKKRLEQQLFENSE